MSSYNCTKVRPFELFDVQFLHSIPPLMHSIHQKKERILMLSGIYMIWIGIESDKKKFYRDSLLSAITPAVEKIVTMNPTRAEKSGFAAEAQNRGSVMELNEDRITFSVWALLVSPTPILATTGKILEKFDKETSIEAMKWIEKVTGETLDYDGTWEQFIAILKDGKVLCKLANTLKPGSIKKVQNSKMAFMQRENVNFFQQFIEKDAGVRADENFQTVDLFEGTNPYAVLITICALARKSEKVFGVSGFGPKESEKQEREWSEEQIRAGDGIIGLQAGYNAGASQAGMNIGNTRHL